MDPHLRAATPGDCPLLVALMSELYAESGYPLNRRRAEAAFSELLADQGLGQVWLIQAEPGPVGYVVLTLGYSMEYGGRDALMIEPPPPWASICRAAACDALSTPERFTAST